MDLSSAWRRVMSDESGEGELRAPFAVKLRLGPDDAAEVASRSATAGSGPFERFGDLETRSASHFGTIQSSHVDWGAELGREQLLERLELSLIHLLRVCLALSVEASSDCDKTDPRAFRRTWPRCGQSSPWTGTASAWPNARLSSPRNGRAPRKRASCSRAGRLTSTSRGQGRAAAGGLSG